MDGLSGIIQKGKKKLDEITKGKPSSVDDAMDELQKVVCAVAERARRLSQWEIKHIGKDAAEAFDKTMAAIKEYPKLVEADGAVHKASNRIRTAALDKARLFREKVYWSDTCCTVYTDQQNRRQIVATCLPLAQAGVQLARRTRAAG